MENWKLRIENYFLNFYLSLVAFGQAKVAPFLGGATLVLPINKASLFFGGGRLVLKLYGYAVGERHQFVVGAAYVYCDSEGYFVVLFLRNFNESQVIPFLQ